MEARNPTNLAPNVRVLTNKHLTDYQLNNLLDKLHDYTVFNH